MQRCLQPLAARQGLMWRFYGDIDPNHHSTDNLMKEEVMALVLPVALGVTLDFMGEGCPLTFNKARLSN